jgi:hypothetical protein
MMAGKVGVMVAEGLVHETLYMMMQAPLIRLFCLSKTD